MKLFIMLAIIMTTMTSLCAEEDVKRWSVGLKYSSFDYYEPGLMSETGSLPGLEVSYYHQVESIPMSHQFEMEYFTGGLRYDGSTQGGTPVQTDTDDSLLGMRWIVDHMYGNYFAPYIGFGLRFWSDRIEGSGGYRRKIFYNYIPIGLRVIYGEIWRFVLELEYDLFLSGKVTSHLEDVDPSLYAAENDQDSGKGFRIQFIVQRGYFYGKLFYRRWDVDDSDYSAVYNLVLYEPKNNTQMIGMTFGARF